MRTNKRRTILIGLCLVFSLVFWQWNDSRKVDLHLHTPSGDDFILTLPNKDRKRLEYFFKELMLQDGSIYTLLGNKPMSLGAYVKPFESHGFLLNLHSLLPPNSTTYWGWQTWLKYQHLFPSSKFALWAEESPWIKEGMIILFINKKAAEGVLKANQEDFLQQGHTSIDNLLQQAKNKPLFRDILRTHEGLIGTLLGYGRNNAWLYQRKWTNNENITLSSFSDLAIQENPSNSRSLFSALTIESLRLPAFAADLTTQETKQLKNTYTATRTIILATYQDKDFLETTLSLLLQ